MLDVWHASHDGLYDVQDLAQPEMNLRGKFLTGPNGGFEFRSVMPCSYPLPTDGPVGRLLAKLGRHPYRPAHIHFIVSAEGYEPVTTQLFVKGDEYLDSDAVFGVKDSLVVEFRRNEGSEIGRPLCTVEYDFVLVPVKKKTPGTQQPQGKPPPSRAVLGKGPARP